MSTLVINKTYDSFSTSSSSQFRFPSLPSKTLSFPADHQTYLRKMTISDSLTVGSSWNLRTSFEAQFRAFSPLGITKIYWSWEKNSSFLAETQSRFGKTTITDLLTVGLSWNYDMWLEIHILMSSPLGFEK